MMHRLRTIRLTVRQMAVIAGCSVLATAVIISSAGRHEAVPSAVIAAYQHRPAVHIVHAPAAARPAGGSVSAAPASVPSAPVPAPTPAPAPSAASDTTTDSGAASPDASSSSDSGSDDSGTDTGSGQTTSTSTGSNTTGAASTPKPKPTYKVKHVFVIALSTNSYRAAFGHGSVASYLNGTLRPKGTLLSGYRSVGSAELPQYLAMVSGQAPNADTNAGCPTYAEFSSGAKAAKNGQLRGKGCIYPNTALTIGDQVTSAGKQWKAYIEDMGSSSCLHANSNALDSTPLTGAGSDYDTRHNPFIYFHSLLDLGGCSSDDVDLTQLPSDLRTAAKTPGFAFIAPGTCEDAATLTCPDGTPSGLAGEDAFLKLWVPRILGSPAYKQDGVLIIAFAPTPPASGGAHDSGSVRTGALILSQYATKARVLTAPYDPYSLLRSVEDLFGYTPLVHAIKAKSFVTTALAAAAGS
jgi:phosphatidylinositol-3-phosphatase